MPRLTLWFISIALVPAWSMADTPVDYARDIKPILAARCFACHGALNQQSGLRLDAVSLIRDGGESGPAIVPGDSGASLIVSAISGADGWQMPPEGEPLSADQIARIKAWIDSGAEAPDEPIPPDPREHWAFKPPVRPEVPQAGGTEHAANPIDAFISSAQRERGVTAQGPADKRTLLRRVYLDLVGLPPTRDEQQAFLADASIDAYEKVVDRLLASPMYGERWGRHWMDVWRYSDWAGYGQEVRYSQRHIWHWRDWIVESLNADKPYDRMLVEMLAGDEVAPDDPQTLRATGFLVRNWYKFNRNTWLEDTVEHTSKALLGLTLNFARCHDHKYDPIAQQDYYRFRAFFEPHEVRTDRLSGEPDLLQAGLPRVYDARAEAPTYLFLRGNEKEPDEAHPLAPGLPEVLCSESLAIEPMQLPPVAYYPSLKPFVQQESLAAATSEVEQTLAAFNAAREKLDLLAGTANKDGQAIETSGSTGATIGNESQPPDESRETKPADDASTSRSDEANASGTSSESEDALAARAELNMAEAALALASKAAAASQAKLLSVQARIAADRARFASPPDPNAKALALAAGRAERQAAVAAAEHDLLAAEQQLVAAEKAEKADDEQTKKALEAAKAAVTASKQALETAVSAAADSNANYTPLEPEYPSTSTGRRLALARWMVDRKNPLTARVAVNHVFLRHFGAPLVPTMFDFGLAGQAPTHPELLDYLAVEFVESGWSMKSLHRLMVTSDTYRRSSSAGAADSESAALDPDNVLLWRGNARRMEAEVVRDSVLHLSGQLDLALGGPEIDHQAGESSRRRSLYFRHAYEKQMLMLAPFDAANPNECYRRTTSVVPQQALALANSRLTRGESRRIAAKLAKRLTAEAPPKAATAIDNGAFVVVAFEHLLCRLPSDEELGRCLAFLDRQAALVADPSQLSPAVAVEGEISVLPSDDPRQRARESLVHVLLNHHDFVTIH